MEVENRKDTMSSLCTLCNERIRKVVVIDEDCPNEKIQKHSNYVDVYSIL
jgi:hypothetical protein